MGRNNHSSRQLPREPEVRLCWLRGGLPWLGATLNAGSSPSSVVSKKMSVHVINPCTSKTMSPLPSEYHSQQNWTIYILQLQSNLTTSSSFSESRKVSQFLHRCCRLFHLKWKASTKSNSWVTRDDSDGNTTESSACWPDMVVRVPVSSDDVDSSELSSLDSDSGVSASGLARMVMVVSAPDSGSPISVSPASVS